MLPSYHLFNTPLQLRKAHLLWKFTAEDSEEVHTNDRKEASNATHIKTRVVDVITIEKSSKSEITFQLTPLSPGQLVIVGVEYSMKAMFPDKEPTDHEIRGKQIFNIAPPHINSVRDRKNRSGVGVDNRLNIKVMGQLPKLVAELQTPDTMLEGELRCCELELRNTGPVAMTSLYLVSQTPGFQSLLLALVTDLPWLLLAVLGVAVLLSFLGTSLHLKLADLLRLEMAVLLLDREGEDVGELLAISVNISLAHFHLDLSWDIVAILSGFP